MRDRGSSVRIPGGVARDKKGYLEDRRPNANMDPYAVATLMVNTICGTARAARTPLKKAAAKKASAKKTTAKKAAAKKTTAKSSKKTPAKKSARR